VTTSSDTAASSSLLTPPFGFGDGAEVAGVMTMVGDVSREADVSLEMSRLREVRGLLRVVTGIATARPTLKDYEEMSDGAGDEKVNELLGRWLINDAKIYTTDWDSGKYVHLNNHVNIYVTIYTELELWTKDYSIVSIPCIDSVSVSKKEFSK